jgi:hypothetical protein
MSHQAMKHLPATSFKGVFWHNKVNNTTFTWGSVSSWYPCQKISTSLRPLRVRETLSEPPFSHVPHTIYLCPVGNIGYGYIFFFELVWGKLVEAIFFLPFCWGWWITTLLLPFLHLISWLHLTIERFETFDCISFFSLFVLLLGLCIQWIQRVSLHLYVTNIPRKFFLALVITS